MEFTINSKQKKVELFYESEKEQAAIMEFISKWLTFKEENIKYQPAYRTDEITWATNSTSRGICESLTGHTYADITSAVIDKNDISDAIVFNAADLSGLTASEDLPTGCIHVTAKSK